jgi:hypothetical protein
MIRIIGVERCVDKALDRVTKEDWVSQVWHAEQLQEEGFDKEIFWD